MFVTSGEKVRIKFIPRAQEIIVERRELAAEVVSLVFLQFNRFLERGPSSDYVDDKLWFDRGLRRQFPTLQKVRH